MATAARDAPAPRGTGERGGIAGSRAFHAAAALTLCTCRELLPGQQNPGIHPIPLCDMCHSVPQRAPTLISQGSSPEPSQPLLSALPVVLPDAGHHLIPRLGPGAAVERR